jgi:hypothetical protein
VAIVLIITAWDLTTARSPREVVEKSAAAATNWMGAEVGLALFGLPGMLVGVTTTEIVKDPEGTVGGFVHCVFGGDCGEIPGKLSDALLGAAPNITELRRKYQKASR